MNLCNAGPVLTINDLSKYVIAYLSKNFAFSFPLVTFTLMILSSVKETVRLIKRSCE